MHSEAQLCRLEIASHMQATFITLCKNKELQLEKNGNQNVVMLSSISYDSFSRNVKSIFKDDFKLKNNNQK